MEFFKTTPRFPFMATRKVWYGISGAMILVTVVSLFVRGLNLAVDFTGGVTIEAAFDSPAKVEAIREDLEGHGYEAQVSNFGSSRDVIIRLPPVPGVQGPQIRAQVEQALKEVDASAEVNRLEIVGPQVGAELRESAWWALSFATLLIFLYVLFRFHTWRLSLGAIVAALYVPLVTVGFFSIAGMSFDLSVVAAVLAVFGYSLNDTVVVFDRIRERFHMNRRAPAAQVLDEAINQTLSRTIMTSITTLIVVLALYILGGPVLAGFSVALIVGIVIGTFSSIYIASAIALDLGLTAEHIFPSEKKTAEDSLP
jgi:preprotein translocase subunit SecF